LTGLGSISISSAASATLFIFSQLEHVARHDIRDGGWPEMPLTLV